MGHTCISHAADSSFPGDRPTLLWAVAFSFLMHRCPPKAALALALLGHALAWGRIDVGVHFPLDMARAALVAALSAWLAFRYVRWLFIAPAYSSATYIHQRLFRRLIQRGWVLR